MRRLLLLVAALTCAATACGGSSGGTTPQPQPSARSSPDIAKFLALPVATPSACPTTANAESVGRQSPWQGTVDVSVFLRGIATPKQIAELRRQLERDSHVAKVYFESQREAYEEFQRLYTCWSSVRRSATPASYRLILTPDTTLTQRDRLVADLARDHIVDGVSCDQSIACLAQLTSPTPKASAH